MEKLLKQLLEEVKQNKIGLSQLKNAAITCNQFDLAIRLKEIDKEMFPETKAIKLAKETAKKIKQTLNMVGVDAPEETCWLIAETLKMYKKKKGEFSLDDATSLRVKKEEIFLSE